MERGELTLNDGQAGYYCVKCDVYWPESYFNPGDIGIAQNRRICAKWHNDRRAPDQ